MPCSELEIRWADLHSQFLLEWLQYSNSVQVNADVNMSLLCWSVGRLELMGKVGIVSSPEVDSHSIAQ